MFQFLASQDVNWWAGFIIVMFLISCLDSHSDGTHSLQSIHCWDSDEMIYFSKPEEETNFDLDGLRLSTSGCKSLGDFTETLGGQIPSEHLTERRMQKPAFKGMLRDYIRPHSTSCNTDGEQVQ